VAQVRPHEGRLGLVTRVHRRLEVTTTGQAPLPALEGGRRAGTRLYGLGQPRLVVLGQQRVTTDLVEVRPHEVFRSPEARLEALARRRRSRLTSSSPSPQAADDNMRLR
jgi:hypothetical protein